MTDAAADKPLVILAPLALEAAALRKAFAGEIAAGRVQVLLIGMRAGRMPALPEARGYVLAGLGGALDPQRAVADVVIDAASTPPIATKTSETGTSETGTQLVSLPPRVSIGPIATAPAVLATAAAKARLAHDSGAVAVEMEAAVVRGRLPAGVPFLHVRAISDTVATELDPAILGLVDDAGRPRPAAVAALLIRHPGRVGTLRQLQADSTRALAALTAALSTILPGWP